jgi:hypothetical protein
VKLIVIKSKLLLYKFGVGRVIVLLSIVNGFRHKVMSTNSNLLDFRVQIKLKNMFIPIRINLSILFYYCYGSLMI